MKRNGISLIVLVITIIVIIILAGAIILSLASNNPILQANKATFLSDLKNFETELTFYETQQFADNLGMYDATKLQADETSVIYDNTVIDGKTMNDIITSLGKTTKYAGQFVVVDGKLVYQGSDTNSQVWSTDAGIQVIVAGEPKVTIIPPAETVVASGTDIIYTVKFSSNTAITSIDLSSKVEILDDNGVVLPIQPVITIGTISGTNADAIRQTNITIKTDSLLIGGYKLKIKSGSAINADGKSNSQDTVSLIGFDIADNIPPENPTMSENPVGWTNGNVTVTITYSEDSAVKEYSLDATNWSIYTSPVIVTENNTTVYSRGKDTSENESGVATLTVTNIDKIVPTVTASSGGATSSSIIVTAVASDNGGSGLNASSYQYSKDNGTTWVAATNATSYTFTSLATGTYQFKVKVADNAGNYSISNAIEIGTASLGTITLSQSPAANLWTNANVNVTVTYPVGITTKEYSLDGTTWLAYTASISVPNNNTTVYARGKDAGGNISDTKTLTVSNIDKIAPTGSVNISSATYPQGDFYLTITGNDTGGSNVNNITWTWSTSGTAISSPSYNGWGGTGWRTQTNSNTASAHEYYSYSGEPTTFYLWYVISDKAGNSTTYHSGPYNRAP